MAKPARRSTPPSRSGGSLLLGIFIGLVLGLGIALGIAFYLNKQCFLPLALIICGLHLASQGDSFRCVIVHSGAQSVSFLVNDCLLLGAHFCHLLLDVGYLLLFGDNIRMLFAQGFLHLVEFVFQRRQLFSQLRNHGQAIHIGELSGAIVNLVLELFPLGG